MAKNISKEITDILKEGTPKQKAVLICRDFTDKETNHLQPLLTRDEAEALRDSLKTNAEKREFNKWIAIYNTYTRLAPTFGLIYAEYRVNANALLLAIRQWEDYSREENHLNYIIDEFKDRKNEESVKVVYEMLEYMQLPYAKIGLDKDGYVEIDVGTPERSEGTLFGLLKQGRKGVYDFLVTLKGFTEVIEEWTKKMRSKAIMPPIMIDALDKAKEDYALYVAPAYSEHELNKRIERGEKVHPFERMKAVFPDYDKVEVPEEITKAFKEKIEHIYESERS